MIIILLLIIAFFLFLNFIEKRKIRLLKQEDYLKAIHFDNIKEAIEKKKQDVT